MFARGPVRTIESLVFGAFVIGPACTIGIAFVEASMSGGVTMGPSNVDDKMEPFRWWTAYSIAGVFAWELVSGERKPEVDPDVETTGPGF